MSDDTVAAYKHIDDCDGNKTISSGRLLLQSPVNPDFLFVASTKDGSRGVHFVEPGGSPTKGHDRWFAGLPDGVTASVEGALPSAMAFVTAGPAASFIVVGHRVITDPTNLGATALYLCEVGFDPADVVSMSVDAPRCWPVLDADDERTAFDVRDIEPDPLNPSRFYVADGGRTSAGSTCAYGESTVLAVEVSIGTYATGGDPEFQVWDTDHSTADTIAWNVDGSGTPQTGTESYYDEDLSKCYARSGVAYGDLVPPNPSGGTRDHEIDTIVVDPAGDYLFAFYKKSDGNSAWGCVSAFRAFLGGLEEDATLPWWPLQGWVNGEMDFRDEGLGGERRKHAGVRAAKVDARGGFMEDEPVKGAWGLGMVHDAIFVPRDTTPGTGWWDASVEW